LCSLRHNKTAMNTKHITALVTFALTFAVSVTIAGFFQVKVNSSTATKITQVLTQDIQNGSSRSYSSRASIDEMALKTQEYVDASQSLDTSDLPDDFQAAWNRHMKAWRIQSNFLNSLDFVDSDAIELDTYNTNEINRTWWEVLRMARKHGAKIPAGAY
jgi:hypothetical protein